MSPGGRFLMSFDTGRALRTTNADVTLSWRTPATATVQCGPRSDRKPVSGSDRRHACVVRSWCCRTTRSACSRSTSRTLSGRVWWSQTACALCVAGKRWRPCPAPLGLGHCAVHVTMPWRRPLLGSRRRSGGMDLAPGARAPVTTMGTAAPGPHGPTRRPAGTVRTAEEARRRGGDRDRGRDDGAAARRPDRERPCAAGGRERR